MDVEGTQRSWWTRRRTLILAASVLLFLPPLALIPQLTADSNFCGTWCPRMFMIWRAGQSGTAWIGGLARAWAGVGLVAVMLVTTLFLGRYWCSHLCPVAAPLELGSRFIPRSLKLDFSRTPAPWFRYGYLLVYFVAPALALGSLCCSYCNFATVPRLFGAAFEGGDLAYFLRTQGLINLGLIVGLGLFSRGGRAYCNLLCPVGAIDALSNKFASRFGKRVRVREDECNGCGTCTDVCPTWAIDVEETAKISQLSCMPCRQCESVCPTEAIYYGKKAG
jgi:ferredoxin-type protein NapH